MPGDYSRLTFDPSKLYSRVRMQQGRVQLDADWNEQAEITAHAQAAALREVVGVGGVAKDSDAFLAVLLPETGDLQDIGILPGRCYVDGRVAINLPSTVDAERVQGQPQRLRPARMSADGAAFATDQWLEVLAPAASLRARITAVDDDAGTLTLSADLSTLPASVGIRRTVSYLHQPFDPAPEFRNSAGEMALADGLYQVYLDLWDREISSVDDPRLLEPALGGADTTTRVQTVWRLGLTPADSAADCDTPLPDGAVAAPSGRMNARTRPPETQDDVCQLPPTAGYRRLENQLYRVEVHRGGDRSTARFKWSRDNGVVATRIEAVDGRVLTVADVGRDEILGFAPTQWVEISSDRSRLRGDTHDLFQIDAVDAASRRITLTTTAAALSGETHLQLRRWDQSGSGATVAGVAMGADWMPLESGVEVLFSDGTYRAGDYWLIPARTATGEIDWPPFKVPNANPLAQPPQGAQHGFCRLALLEVAGGTASLTDCRAEFPPLTGICAEDVCFDNAVCAMPEAHTVQDALDALCARPIGGNPVVTGTVVFRVGDRDDNEFVSGFIDPGLGPGQLQVVLAVEQGRDEPAFFGPVDVFDAFEYPSVITGAEVRPADGRLRVAIRIQNRQTLQSTVRVRWWATQPADDRGEVVVGPRPTIGPTIVPTIGPTVGPTIGPTFVPPTIVPTVGPTISPTIVPTVGPTIRPTINPTIAPTIVPTLRPTIGPGPGPVARPLTDVQGIGTGFAERLTAAGINDAAALGGSDVATVASVLGVSEVRARSIVEAARRLNNG